MNKISKLILFAFVQLVLFCMTSVKGSCQFKSVRVKITGLTCSLCSKGVESALRKISFIESIDMDLNETTAVVHFNHKSPVDLEMVADKIEEGGFSVSRMEAEYLINGGDIVSDSSITGKDHTLRILKNDKTKLQNLIKFQVIGLKFMKKKDYELWKERIKKDEIISSKIYYIVL